VITVTEDNFFSHFNSLEHHLYVSFDEGLVIDRAYNITVGFSSDQYLFKGNTSNATAHGTIKGDFQRLQELIEKALDDGRDELNLTRSYRFTEAYIVDGVVIQWLDNRSMNLTKIDRPFTINGNGWTIDARGFSRIFDISASNITFNNFVFADGDANGTYRNNSHFDCDMGGALYWAGENGNLVNCLVYNNEAERGGGLYYNASAPNCKIINTTFTENVADTYGGAIDCNASKMRLENTVFELNRAEYGAALCS
jgi:predicted outer membrane repeat protein